MFHEHINNPHQPIVPKTRITRFSPEQIKARQSFLGKPLGGLPVTVYTPTITEMKGKGKGKSKSFKGKGKQGKKGTKGKSGK